jgi:hypothetical protein
MVETIGVEKTGIEGLEGPYFQYISMSILRS